MRLSSAVKKSIIDSIISDVPTTDFQAIAREELLAAAVETLPTKVRKVWDDPTTRCFVKLGSYWSNGLSAKVPSFSEHTVEPPPAAAEQFGRRASQNDAQKDTLKQLRAQISASLESVTTVKAFVERFPQFAAYAPNEAKVANLPATQALTDKLKLLGWTQPEAEANA